MKVISNWYALVEGAVLVGFGLFLLKSAGLFVSGTAGLGLIASYVTGMSFGFAFLLINVPFFVLAWLVIGKGFVFKTLFSIVLVSLIADLLLYMIDIAVMPPVLAAVIAGAVIAVGMMVILKSGGSLGGVNILAVFLERKLGIAPSKSILFFDVLIALLGGVLLGFEIVMYSAVSALVMSSVLGRYYKPVKPAVSSIKTHTHKDHDGEAVRVSPSTIVNDSDDHRYNPV